MMMMMMIMVYVYYQEFKCFHQSKYTKAKTLLKHFCLYKATCKEI